MGLEWISLFLFFPLFILFVFFVCLSVFCFSSFFFVFRRLRRIPWWTFRPRKKIFSPPPRISRCAADALPAPRPLPAWRRPPWDFQLNIWPPHTPELRTPHSPSPSRKKIKNIRSVHEDSVFSAHLQAVAVDGPSVFSHGENCKKGN